MNLPTSAVARASSRARQFTLDETYCLAHLPLVNPAHPRGMARKEGTYYEHGQHRRVYSLVPPVPQEALDGSRSYRQLEAELRDEPFASKIDVAPCRTATAQSSCDHLRIIVHGRASRDQSRDTTTAFGPRAGVLSSDVLGLIGQSRDV